MKKLILLLPLFALTACANGSMFDAFGGGTGGGGKIDKAKAKQIYEDNIYGVDTSKCNFTMEWIHRSETYDKKDKETYWEEEKYTLKMTEDRYFYFAKETKSEGDSHSSKAEFYYAQSAKGEDVGYRIDTGWDGKIQKQVAYVGTYDYENDSNDRAPYSLSSAIQLSQEKDLYTSLPFSYLEQMAFQAFADSSTGLEYVMETTYSSKNSKSLEIKGEMKLVSKPDYTLGVIFGSGTITFENSRFTKLTDNYGNEYTNEKYTMKDNLTFSYPSKLKIELPSDWSRYVVS